MGAGVWWWGMVVVGWGANYVVFKLLGDARSLDVPCTVLMLPLASPAAQSSWALLFHNTYKFTNLLVPPSPNLAILVYGCDC